MNKIIETIVGDLSEKRRYRDAEKRAGQLPGEYAEAYKNIRNYIWGTAGITSIDPLVALVDLLEESATNGTPVLEVTGTDVAAFADELVRGEASYKTQQAEKLNRKMSKE